MTVGQVMALIKTRPIIAETALNAMAMQAFGFKPSSWRLVRLLQALGEKKKPAMALARQAKRAVRLQWRDALNVSSSRKSISLRKDGRDAPF